jgi:heptaprenylglycerol acetyltransferase
MSQTKENLRELPHEHFLSGMKNRILQELAKCMPGAFTVRVLLHRWRGVKIGQRVHIAYGVVIETAYPHWVFIGNNVQIGIRSTIVAHLHGLPPWKAEQQEDYSSVRIEDDAYLGPGVIVLPNVTIGCGAVITAGSVVTRSVPPMTIVQGNPAKPIAQCEIPLKWDTPYKEFLSRLRPLKQ